MLKRLCHQQLSIFNRGVCSREFHSGVKNITTGEILRAVCRTLEAADRDRDPEFNALSAKLIKEVGAVCRIVGRRQLGEDRYKEEEARWVADKLRED